jgi:hypothetical protein
MRVPPVPDELTGICGNVEAAKPQMNLCKDMFAMIGLD